MTWNIEGRLSSSSSILWTSMSIKISLISLILAGWKVLSYSLMASTDLLSCLFEDSGGHFGAYDLENPHMASSISR